MFLALLGLLASLGISFWYLYHWQVFFNSDFAMIGLLGERILRTGETYLYVPTVGYQGLLIEAYLSAFLFKWFGMTPKALHLTAVIAFLILVFWFYQAARVWFGKKEAQLSVLFLCSSSPLFFGHVLRTQPNYPETFALGCFLFWAFKKWTDSRKDKFFYWVCFGSGFGFYLYGQILYFALALFVSYLSNKVKAKRKIPMVLVVGLLVSLLPTVTIRGVPIPGPSIGVGCFFLWVLSNAWKSRQDLALFLANNKKRLFIGGAFFLIGYAPSLYHRFVLGQFAKSGIKLIKFSEEFWLNAKILFLHSSDFLVGSEFKLASALVSAIGIGIVFFVFQQALKRKEKWLNPFCLLGPIVFIGFLSSRSVCEPFSLRYILVFHLILSVSLAAFSWFLLERRKAVGVCFVLVWLGLGVHSNLRAPSLYRRQDLYNQLTRWEDIKDLVDYLDSQKIHSGYSDYWPAYLINFVTQERTVLEPIYTNYLPFYEARIKKEPYIVLIKAKNRLSAGPDMSKDPKEIILNEIKYRIAAEKEFIDWKLWHLERIG